MKFYDNILVFLQAGNGGNGACTFRRVKYVPDGGPDGGNGGNGGSIILKASSNFNSLSFFHLHPKHRAEAGSSGGGQNRHGRNGQDLILYAPIGTEVLSEDGELLLCDLVEDGQEYLICQGGRGGAGNVVFKTSTNRAPYRTLPGGKGEFGSFLLRLKLISDVGIVGAPNAGKSSLISAITNAKSKIDSYAFTTTYPILGVIKGIAKHITLCDIPGLIPGASSGAGLGIAFLQHISRCKTFVHLIDCSQNPVEDYLSILKEMQNYDATLLDKKVIVVLNKIDLISEVALKKLIHEFRGIKFCGAGLNPIAISIKDNIGIGSLVREIESLTA